MLSLRDKGVRKENYNRKKMETIMSVLSSCCLSSLFQACSFDIGVLQIYIQIRVDALLLDTKNSNCVSLAITHS